MPMSFERGPNPEMIRKAKLGSHLNDLYHHDDFSHRMMLDDFDATIKHFDNEGDTVRAAFLIDEKKRYEDNTYPESDRRDTGYNFRRITRE